MPAGATLEWTAEAEFRVDDVEYVCRPYRNRVPSTPGRFCLLKARWSVERYVELLQALAPRHILEVGVYDGGSTALFAQLARPAKLIAVDVRDGPSDALGHFVETHGLGDVVRVCFGVDQGDAPRLAHILDTELDGHALDLVIDDASHLVDQTRRTFNGLFPRLRPGGIYVIEDWSWAHSPLPVWEDQIPLTVFVFELVLACAYQPALIADVTVNRGWALVRRGDAPIDAATFDVGTCLGERGRQLLADVVVNA